MRRSPIVAAALAALVSLQSPLPAQVPGIPGVGGVPGGAAIPGAAAVPGAAGTTAPAAPNNIWSKLCPTQEQLQACLQKLCSIPLFQFLQGAIAPMSAVSGGLVPQLCPGPNDPNPADLLKPADSAEGAASRIKKLEAEAKARRAAVRYLGTVDCRRFPEAEAALINSLRGDTNECVRIEAALALSNGCCCTRKVLEALVLTVAARRTNDPAETSLRVRAAAAYALERCLKRYCEIDLSQQPATTPPEPPKPPEGPEPPVAPPPAVPARAAFDPLAEDGKRVLAAFKAQYGPPTAEPPPAATEAVAAGTPAPAPVRTAAPTPVRVAVVPLAPMPAETAPRPNLVVTDQSQGPARPLPPTGQRDVWSVFRHTLRDR